MAWRNRLAEGAVLVSWLAAAAVHAETLTVWNSPAGTTPLHLGYNLGHFMPGSNAADWFRYSGADAARIFINVSEIEPVDDLPPAGDGVTSEASFFSRRALLRANGASAAAALDPALVNWASFTANYDDTAAGNNRLTVHYALGTLRGRGIAILANLTASPNRFPITTGADWAGKWELWQHYYAQAFLLARDYGVQNFSMFNEPNGWDGLLETDWLMRCRICSDALQSAVADMNSRYGRTLEPRIFAPNTANGAEKYNTSGADADSTDTWGREVVANRHLRLDGTTSSTWMNLHVYNYQKYTTRTHSSGGLSGFVTDYHALRTLINADMPGGPPLPMALTEFNVRTGAHYDTTTATLDSPADFTALGANLVALTECGIQQLYLFKFAQTASTSTYGVAKNGTHYVQNANGSGHHYGGATKTAEVYRLFVKAARGARTRLNVTATAGASATPTGGVWSMVTRDPASGTCQVFLVNRGTAPIPLEVNFTALGVPPENPVYVEEVSRTCSGAVIRLASLAGGKWPTASLPGQAVWLITVPMAEMGSHSRVAVADTGLGDGAASSQTGGSLTAINVRADGTVDGRRAALIRIPVPLGNAAGTHSVLLELQAATTAGTEPVQAHVYGVEHNTWAENGITWETAGGILKRGVPAGSLIRNNVVSGQGTSTRMLGQMLVTSRTPGRYRLDVTEFAKSRTDGLASFLIVQDHRWDTALPELTAGDPRAAGLAITSREAAGEAPRLTALGPPPPWTRWRKDHFPAAWENDAVSGPVADPDLDGLPNLLEYALGGNPLTPGREVLPSLEWRDGNPEFHCRRLPAHVDLRCTIQITDDPSRAWVDAAVSSGGAPFTALPAGMTVQETGTGAVRGVTLSQAPVPPTTRGFLRLRIELLNP